MRSNDKQGFTRFSEIISFPCRFFYAVRFTGMLNTQLVIIDLVFLNFLQDKERPMLFFHADSFQDTVIVKKYPEHKKSKGNLKKKLFGVRTNILPDFIDNLFHTS